MSGSNRSIAQPPSGSFYNLKNRGKQFLMQKSKVYFLELNSYRQPTVACSFTCNLIVKLDSKFCVKKIYLEFQQNRISNTFNFVVTKNRCQQQTERIVSEFHAEQNDLHPTTVLTDLVNLTQQTRNNLSEFGIVLVFAAQLLTNA